MFENYGCKLNTATTKEYFHWSRYQQATISFNKIYASPNFTKVQLLFHLVHKRHLHFMQNAGRSFYIRGLSLSTVNAIQTILLFKYCCHNFAADNIQSYLTPCLQWLAKLLRLMNKSKNYICKSCSENTITFGEANLHKQWTAVNHCIVHLQKQWWPVNHLIVRCIQISGIEWSMSFFTSESAMLKQNIFSFQDSSDLWKR